MKSSLVWRSIVVVLVLAGWVYSLFPIHDRDFLGVLRNEAAAELTAFEKTAPRAEAKVAKLQQRLDDMADKSSATYTRLDAERRELEAEAKRSVELLERFTQLLADTEQLLAEDPSLAAYMAVREAAKGTSSRRRVALNQFVHVPTQPKASNKLVLSYLRRKAAGKLRLGLDLRGGTEFVLGFNPDELPSDRRGDPAIVRDQIIEILRNRVDVMGVVEPEIKQIGPTSISLRMPMVSEGDKADIRRTIKQTAKLEFKLVHPRNNALVQQYHADPEAFQAPTGYEYREMEVERDGVADMQVIFVRARPERLSGEEVIRGRATYNEFGNYRVTLALNTRGAAAFYRITEAHVGEQLAIVLDGKVYSAPTINEPIAGGNAEITGGFTAEEARRLAGVIESGNLPVSISIDSEFGTDPTLGADSIRSGTWAAVCGMICVVLFMVAYYRLAGVIAVSALACNILLVMGTLTLTGATITLPGIAGIVLTIGMAVDANVLIFERIREECRKGKSIGNAVKAGYGRAFVTILDSNLTTLLTALILFRVGTGPIRGFAVTLSIGIVASMFTALFMTRAVFDLLLYLGRLRGLQMASLFTNPKIDFLKLKRVAIGFSGVLLVVSLAWVGVRGSSVLSIDFLGGTEVTYRYTGSVEAPSVATIRQGLDAAGYQDCRIGYKYSVAQGGRLLEVVLPERSTDEEKLDLDRIAETLNAAADGDAFRQVQTTSVGGLIGAQFQKQAVIAAVLAAIGIIVYISFRFEFAYGVASVVALVHDVIIAGGLYLLCGRQLSLPVVAALLTIMGYSLNDTIVVFDRIREDLALQKGGTYAEIINLSINQTLARTVLTSVTTLLVVLVLFLFGGGAINDFALVMLLGICVGTYSSIFVASIIVAAWHKRARGHTDAA